MSKIVCVVPSIRPAEMSAFVEAWTPLFDKHGVQLVTVWDGENPVVQWTDFPSRKSNQIGNLRTLQNKDIFYRFTDSVRNLGFYYVAASLPDTEYVLTLDDDVRPLPGEDPIRAHLEVLNKRVSLSWMNTALGGDPFLRGVPYKTREDSRVMLSHGTWVGTPDFDGETQLAIEREKGEVPYSLDYYVGPVPRYAYFPLCGMNVMIRLDALPYLYYAPMGPDTGVPNLHRFGDIWMGIHLKREFDMMAWACYTGGATVLHSRKSDAEKNVVQEKLGREWNEVYYKITTGFESAENHPSITYELMQYYRAYKDARHRYCDLIMGLIERV